ncbi:hypothetical protein K1719_044312 [Acacia pycnantha]|nr:hypothetical protein K1719_044312 [Acacia pycnantha]
MTDRFLDDFGSLSSPVALDLAFNNFVNLPSGCFSGLFQLRFLSLDSCEGLSYCQGFHRLIVLHATSCDSMETPLSSMNKYGIWLLQLTMSRGRTKYDVIPDENYDYGRPLDEREYALKCVPPREISLQLFQETKYHHGFQIILGNALATLCDKSEHTSRFS